MATPKVWRNVNVTMQSALATALVISAISKANPGVVSYTGADPVNGDYVLLPSVNGMHQVSGRVFRVAGVDGGANTFQLEGEDTTGYDTFSSGSAQVITFGNSIATATQISVSGGTFPQIDTTTIHDAASSSIPGLPEASIVNFDNIWDIADAGLRAMKAAFIAQQTRAFKFVFGTGGNIWLFNGYVGASLNPGGQAQGLVTTPATITVQKESTFYSA